MRSLVIGSIVFVSLVSLTLAAVPAQERDASKRVAELLEKLGSPKFAERENAMKELEALGFNTLPSLRPALKSTDAEVRRRVEILVRKFEDQELSTKLLTAKMVRLKLKDASVAEAAAELEKQSYPINLPDDLKKNTDVKITLDTGDTTFWQALHQLSQKAGVPMWSMVPPSTNRKSAMDLAALLGLEEKLRSTTIPLAKLTSHPVSFAGSICVTLVTTRQLTAEVELILDVFCEPHFVDLASAGAPTLSKAVDENGQKLTAVLAIDPFAPAKAAPGPVLANRIATPAARAPQPRSGFQTFQSTLRIKHEAKPSKEIKELTGKIPVRTMVETEPEFEMDNILKAAGKSIKGKGDKTLQVMGVEQTADGEVIVKVAIETPNAHNAVAVGAVVRVQQVQAIQVIKNANGGNNIVPDGLPSSFLRLFDAAGKAFVQKAQMGGSASIAAGKMTEIETVVFTPSEGQGAAARLVLPGYRLFEFEVPFSFKDIELR